MSRESLVTAVLLMRRGGKQQPTTNSGGLPHETFRNFVQDTSQALASSGCLLCFAQDY
jgi:hypothetical protein